MKKSVLKSELGQMSVFLALVFQVLFVFFAMVINVGLLVHDKINLQNSVDLGAYYAAQKQAEILNEIAHLNYQIRQDYKLLAWRYWVLGTLGRNGKGLQPPPAVGGPLNDQPRQYVPDVGLPSREETPVACLAAPYWWEFAALSKGNIPDENYCWHPYNWTSPEIKITPVSIAPALIAITRFTQTLALQSRANYNESCDSASPLSWAFVAQIMTNYKYSIAYKKKAIRKLRENLVSVNPTDREGKSIREGVIQTIKKNLTESNLQSFSPEKVQMLNGLSQGGCALGDSIYPGAMTLPEILTSPGLYFAVLKGNGRVCSFDVGFQFESNRISGGVAKYDPDGAMSSMLASEPGPDSEYHSSLGFEKNPWCMAYMGVKTSTSPRKPFAPFGKSVNLVARAFAQPFGGRIGPWYAKRWMRGEKTSETIAQPSAGPVIGNAPAKLNPADGQSGRTDMLTSPRVVPGSGGYSYSAYTIPNYSRYPGDPWGLRSMRTQSLSRHFFMNINIRAGAQLSQPLNFNDRRVRLNWFLGFAGISTTGDTLAFDDPAVTAANAVPVSISAFRQVEMAAVAPDLFDLTYYSIDPQADANYGALQNGNASHYGIGDKLVGDLGSRQNVNEFQHNNVTTQIAAVLSSGIDETLLPAAYWLVRDWRHLLTGWAPHRATDFSFPTDRFGKCQGDALKTAMIPGACATGGRTGYSVRLISREHLNGSWQVGGEGAQPGTLLNPPGDDSQF